jgi:hypothetical protein
MGKKTLYEQPKSARYKFQIPRFNGTYETHWVDVLVVGETAKSYQLQVVVPFNYHEKGERLFALKKNVVFEKEVVDTSEFWYNNVEK